MIQDGIYIRKNKGDGEHMFFMRFTNNTAQNVTVNLSSLVGSWGTPQPTITTAEVERTAGPPHTNVRAGVRSLNTFTVSVGESCVFRMKWDGGLFTLRGTSSNSYNNIVRSAGFKLRGNYNIPGNFMSMLFYFCVNYNQQPGDVFDASGLIPIMIGNDFMAFTFRNCSSLTTAAVPDTSNWNITTIDNNFLYHTWYGCSSLTTAVAPNTTNWNVMGIADYFLYGTWGACSSLITPVVPNTTNWNVLSVGDGFMESTWMDCLSLTTAITPNTTNWNVMSIGGSFMPYTWGFCGSLTSAILLNTTNWVNLQIGNVGSNFMNETFYYAFLLTGVGTTCELRGPLYLVIPFAKDSAGIINSRIQNIKVDPTRISQYQSSGNFNGIFPKSKFISW